MWLDADLTSPYQMYQYWIQTPDADAVAYLKLFTFLTRPEIDELAAATAAKPEARDAQRALAAECTRIVHGSEAVSAVISTCSPAFVHRKSRTMNVAARASAVSS